MIGRFLFDLITRILIRMPHWKFHVLMSRVNRASGHDPKCPTCQKHIKAICRFCGWEAE